MPAARKKIQNPVKGAKSVFIPSGTFTYDDQIITVLISAKTGEAAFEIDGQRVEDPEMQNKLVEHFLSINMPDHKSSKPAAK